MDDPVRKNQSKYRSEDGELRYSADGSRVFPGANGIRTQATAAQDGAAWATSKGELTEMNIMSGYALYVHRLTREDISLHGVDLSGHDIDNCVAVEGEDLGCCLAAVVDITSTPPALVWSDADGTGTPIHPASHQAFADSVTLVLVHLFEHLRAMGIERPIHPRYGDALRIVHDFTEGLATENSEYVRGQLELMADMFPGEATETDERVEQIAADIRALETR